MINGYNLEVNFWAVLSSITSDYLQNSSLRKYGGKCEDELESMENVKGVRVGVKRKRLGLELRGEKHRFQPQSFRGKKGVNL